MAEIALAVCSPTKSDFDVDTMHVEVDLDDTQVFEPGGKRWTMSQKRCVPRVRKMPRAKQPRKLCRLMMRDAEKREQRLVERDKRMMEHLDVVVKGISESLEVRMTNSEVKVQTQWTAFERKWEEKIVEPDS